MTRRVVGVALLAVMSVAGARGVRADEFTDAQAASLLVLVNDHRAGEHGLPPLQANEVLREIAQRQAQRMVAAGYLYHNPRLAEEVTASLPGLTLLGENIGYDRNATSMLSDFLGSPPHHENIDEPSFDRSDVGVVAGGADDEMLYFTQVFVGGSSRSAAPPPRVAPKARARPATALATAAPPTPGVATPAPDVVIATSAPPSASPPAAPAKPSPRRITLVGSLVGSFREAFSRLIPG